MESRKYVLWTGEFRMKSSSWKMENGKWKIRLVLVELKPTNTLLMISRPILHPIEVFFGYGAFWQSV